MLIIYRLELMNYYEEGKKVYHEKKKNFLFNLLIISNRYICLLQSNEHEKESEQKNKKKMSLEGKWRFIRMNDFFMMKKEVETFLQPILTAKSNSENIFHLLVSSQELNKRRKAFFISNWLYLCIWNILNPISALFTTILHCEDERKTASAS